jgi:hypothetical protein
MIFFLGPADVLTHRKVHNNSIFRVEVAILESRRICIGLEEGKAGGLVLPYNYTWRRNTEEQNYRKKICW